MIVRHGVADIHLLRHPIKHQTKTRQKKSHAPSLTVGVTIKVLTFLRRLVETISDGRAKILQAEQASYLAIKIRSGGILVLILRSTNAAVQEQTPFFVPTEGQKCRDKPAEECKDGGVRITGVTLDLWLVKG